MAASDVGADEAQVVAAARAGQGGAPPVCARAHDQADAWRALDRPHAPHQHHRPKGPVVAKEAWREVGDLDATAPVVEQPRAQDRGVFVIGLFGLHAAFEYDLQTAVRADAVGRIQQRVEHRVGVEARHAAPHEARAGVDQRTDRAIADEAEVQAG